MKWKLEKIATITTAKINKLNISSTLLLVLKIAVSTYDVIIVDAVVVGILSSFDADRIDRWTKENQPKPQ